MMHRSPGIEAAPAKRRSRILRLRRWERLVCAWAACLCSGCRLLPPNNFRLITTEPAGEYPPFVHFTHGTFLDTDGHGVAMLSGRTVVVLFDLRGPSNRFELMLRAGDDRALYERIGTHASLLHGAPVAEPYGITWRRTGGGLRGAVDVYVARSERRDVGTSFEHYPRAMRVVGYVVIPPSERPDHPLASLFSPQGTGGQTTYPDLHTLEPPIGPDRLSPILEILPPLPLIDVEYLLPDSIATVFRPEQL